MSKPNPDEIHKYPRLYVDAGLAEGLSVSLEAGHNHYLRNVLRKQEGDLLRVFNGRDGEWLARISGLGKKAGEAVLEERLRVQPDGGKRAVHLYFSPIKKQRMDMLVEKAVELGVTYLHPVIMHRTETRKIKEDRIRAQIIEAAEQCERLDMPVLEAARSMDEMLAGLEVCVFACVERSAETKALGECELGGDVAFLIGPEGGFDPLEVEQLFAHEQIVPVSLGENILRAETAAIACLAWVLGN
jgi:16S rRNA (uracil1498-N3)-methyltransferase